MNARKPYLRPLAALVAVGVALTLSACSDDPEPKEASATEDSQAAPDEDDAATDDGKDDSADGDVEAFCTDATSFTDGTLFEDMSDPTSDDLTAAYDSALASIDAIEAPSEIADDWSTLTDAMRVMLEAMSGLDYESETAVDDMLELTESMNTAELEDASANVEAYIADNCDAPE